MAWGYLNDIDFDTVRTAAIEIVRGQALAAAAYILCLFEPLREPYVPKTTGQTAAAQELLTKPKFATFDGLIGFLRENIFAYHYGLAVDKDFQNFQKESAQQDLQGKIAAYKLVRLDSLATTFDSAGTVMNLVQVEAFITTSDAPAAQICSVEGIEEATKVAAIGLPMNCLIDIAAPGYAPGVIAGRLGMSKFNNAALMPYRGHSTVEMYRTYVDRLREHASTQRAKMIST